MQSLTSQPEARRDRHAQFVDSFRILSEYLDKPYVLVQVMSDGTIGFISRSVKSVLGHSPEDCIGIPWLAFIDSNMELNSEEQLNSSSETPPPVRVVSVRHADGSLRTWHLTSVDTSFVRINSASKTQEYIARDISSENASEVVNDAAADVNNCDNAEVAESTEQLRVLNDKLQQEIEVRRQAEARLHQSELRYRSIVEDQTEFIVRFNAEGCIEFANQAYMQAYGLTPESLAKANIFDYLPTWEQNRVRDQIGGVSPAAPTGAEVLRILNADGTYRWEEWHGRAVFDDDGGILTFQAVGRDITDLKEAQDRLWQSELHYRSIVEDQRELIVRFDPQGLVTFANKAYCDANGLTLKEVLGKPYYFRIHEDDRDEVIRMVNDSNANFPEQASESRAYRADGSVAWESWTGRALFDAEGRHCGFQAVGRDVTQLHDAQEKLREKELQLAHLARVSALGEMVAGISHEINQPLAAIANFSSASLLLLEHGKKDQEACEKLQAWIKRISRQTDRINAIIQRLKRFGRPGSQREDFHIREAIDEALMVTETRTRNTIDTIQVNCAAHLSTVNADRIQIEQVLVNLIRNACDAMERLGGIERRLQFDASESDGFVCVTVTDSGPGISAEAACGVFDSFVTSKSEGMGIGLAISRSIIEAHDGRIRAIADSGHGCFQFTLPTTEYSRHE